MKTPGANGALADSVPLGSTGAAAEPGLPPPRAVLLPADHPVDAALSDHEIAMRLAKLPPGSPPELALVLLGSRRYCPKICSGAALDALDGG